VKICATKNAVGRFAVMLMTNQRRYKSSSRDPAIIIPATKVPSQAFAKKAELDCTAYLKDNHGGIQRRMPVAWS
jgi:hypothetical protein